MIVAQVPEEPTAGARGDEQVEVTVVVEVEPGLSPAVEGDGVTIARPAIEQEIQFDPPTIYHAFDGSRQA